MPKSKAEAATYTVTTLPDSQASVDEGLMLQLLKNNVSWNWKSVTGTYQDYDDNTGIFYCPRPSGGENGGWSYSNVLEVNFTNAGTILGRKVNAIITIDKIEVTTNKDYSSAIVPSSIEFFRVGTTYCPQFGCSVNGTLCHQMFIDYTVTITWADTGKIVDMPFYQRVQDLDQGGSPYPFEEAWTADDGFDGQFYVYESCALGVNAPRFSTCGYGTDGTPAITQAGAIGRTENGQFSGRFEEEWCSTGLEIFSEFTSLSDPVKSYSVTYK